LVSKEDFEWNLGRILSRLESIGHGNIFKNNLGLSFKVLRNQDKVDGEMMKRLVMEQWDLIHMEMMSR
jgi:hypothetical protein